MFRYTAAGQKVARLVYQHGKPMLRTDYLSGFQYEGDSLRFFPHAEGRVLRVVSTDAAGQATTRYQREFSFKDHLGNLRLAYRAGRHRRDSTSLEPADAARDTQRFDSLSVRAPIAQNVGSALARSGSYAARLNAGGTTPQPLGPLRQLAVQKGDTVTVTAYGFYAQPVRNNFWFSLGTFLTGLLNPAQGTPANGPDPARGRAALPLLQVGVAAGLSSLPQLSNGVPKGYLRLLVFNADSVLVSQQIQQLTSAALNNYQPLRLSLLVPQDGYVTTYVGNESDVDVLFDDVTVVHGQGLQVQETQYDPTGLEMAGLDGTTPGLKPLSQYKWNGKEFQTDLGLNWTQLDWRMFDPQLDDTHAVDPEVENGQESMSPYAFAYDNAVRFNDPDGRNPGDGLMSQAVEFFNGAANAIASNASTLGPASGIHRITDRTGAFAGGQKAGDVVSLVQAAGEMFLGGTMVVGGTAGGAATSPTVVGGVAGAAVAVAGAGVAGHGAVTGQNAMRNLFDKGNGRVNASNVQQNKAKGDAYEKAVKGELSAGGHNNIAEQVSVKPNGTNPKTGKDYKNTRLDFLSTLPGGNLAATEAKSSATAGLTRNQRAGFPALNTNGGTVVGNAGAAQGYPAGTKIPAGTVVDIKRP